MNTRVCEQWNCSFDDVVRIQIGGPVFYFVRGVAAGSELSWSEPGRHCDPAVEQARAQFSRQGRNASTNLWSGF